ncbi:MAG: DUF1553 domain-containing protein [Planctomycetaceae bacterium]
MNRVFPVIVLWIVATFAGASLAALFASVPPNRVEPGPAARKTPGFEKTIAPILIRRCLECHNASDVKGGLDLTSRKALLKGGESGAAVDLRRPEKSLLVERIAGGEMPPETRPKLTRKEIAALTAWVKGGAHWPRGRVLSLLELSTERRAGLDWWSLRPVRRPKIPPQMQTGHRSRNAIDAFVSARLRMKGLSPSPPADRRTLIRRMSLVIRGLPPTADEIRRFLDDDRPEAYERLIDGMLADPRYGERWARHWLDVARFAETNGFETNTPRPNAWRYRDYVIRAFNDDTPYDRFVKEQLAGDALGAGVATGFLVAGSYDTVKSPDVNLTLAQRQAELHDMINATGTAFLGLTVACARCHNHKFDPILQKDYYALQAVLAGVRHGDRRVPTVTDESRRRRLVETRRQLERLQKALSQLGLRESVNARRNEERFEPVAAKFVRFTILATNSSEPCLDELEIWSAKTPRNVALATAGAKATSSGDYSGNPKHKLAHIHDGKYGNAQSWISNRYGKGWVQIELAKPELVNRVVWGRDREERYKDRLPTRYRIEVATKPNAWRTVASSEDRLPLRVGETGVGGVSLRRLSRERRREATRLIGRMRELPAAIAALSKPAVAYAGTFRQPGLTHRLFRGDPLAKREVVAPGAIGSLGRPLGLKSTTAEKDRRLALAGWIADARNPLTARVMVNRIWQHHFGRGLVATPSDFGKMGVRPTHPELLDWLADEFVRSGWSVKHIQRLILQSATWRQSSRPREKAMQIDADSRLLWRFSPRRLEAEAVRDSVLHAAGTLRSRMGGPGFSAFQPNANYVRNYVPKENWGPAEWRRMIYMTKVRMEQDAVFGALDCPDAGQVTDKRSRSTTPLQALNLLNSSFMLQQAELMAAGIARNVGGGLEAQVRRAFRRTYGRQPSADEIRNGVALVRKHGLRALCRALLNSNEFLFLQ